MVGAKPAGVTLPRGAISTTLSPGFTPKASASASPSTIWKLPDCS